MAALWRNALMPAGKAMRVDPVEGLRAVRAPIFEENRGSVRRDDGSHVLSCVCGCWDLSPNERVASRVSSLLGL